MESSSGQSFIHTNLGRVDEEMIPRAGGITRKCKNAVQSRKKLTDVLTVRQWQNWFAKFRSGNFDVEDAPRSGRPVEADKDAIKALVDANRRITANT
ncbi:histone-lysine N-methyltransferase SETMAR [Trichonephila clavipes]|nr:histone-lysine N-methyltransferase SETMAR [Trichonephila clavipes]